MSLLLRKRLGAIAVAALPAVLAAGAVGLPAAHAVEPATVEVTLGPGQDGQVAKVVETPDAGVTPVADCDPGLSIAFDENLVTTVHVATDSGTGTYGCTVDFQIQGQSFGLIEEVTVYVPGLSVDDVTVTEGNSGTVPATFTVTRSGSSDNAITAHYATTPGTATGPDDYTPVSGTVTLASGETSKTLTVPVSSDTVDELDEGFSIGLTDAEGAAVTSGSGTGTVLDDDRNGVFSCRASVLYLLGTEPTVANDPNTPCADDDRTVDQSSLTLSDGTTVSIDTMEATTDQTPDVLSSTAPAAGDSGMSTATVSIVTISSAGTSAQLTVLTAHAVAECVSTPSGLVPQFTGSSSVISMSVDGTPVVTGSEPETIPLGFGTLYLNHTIIDQNSVNQRAVWLHTIFGDVVASQASAGVQGTFAHPGGNPCETR